MTPTDNDDAPAQTQAAGKKSSKKAAIANLATTLREARQARKESQSRFWGRFGVTQSRGSRFELGNEIPSPVSILIKLYLEGVVSDGDLWRARRNPKINMEQKGR
jgi:hypothetical protein